MTTLHFSQYSLTWVLFFVKQHCKEKKWEKLVYDSFNNPPAIKVWQTNTCPANVFNATIYMLVILMEHKQTLYLRVMLMLSLCFKSFSYFRLIYFKYMAKRNEIKPLFKCCIHIYSYALHLYLKIFENNLTCKVCTERSLGETHNKILHSFHHQSFTLVSSNIVKVFSSTY